MVFVKIEEAILGKGSVYKIYNHMYVLCIYNLQLQNHVPNVQDFETNFIITNCYLYYTIYNFIMQLF